mmetsp:Transcript_10695/g.21209  ORF Transcript_10695/g.21209 Transcript_10695/m.21209 type:complete len:248 (-) Transcript_10695:118-861(-)
MVENPVNHRLQDLVSLLFKQYFVVSILYFVKGFIRTAHAFHKRFGCVEYRHSIRSSVMSVDGQREITLCRSKCLEPLHCLLSCPDWKWAYIIKFVIFIFFNFFRIFVHVRRHNLWHDPSPGDGCREYFAECCLHSQRHCPFHVQKWATEQETVPLGLVFQTRQRSNHSSEAMAPDEKGYVSPILFSAVLSRLVAQVVKVCNQAVQTFKIHPLYPSTLSVSVGIARVHSNTIFCHSREYVRVPSDMLT